MTSDDAAYTEQLLLEHPGMTAHLQHDWPRPQREVRLVVRMSKNATMSRGKYAAQAVHAALELVGAHPHVPVIVLGGNKIDIEQMPVVIHDAGRTELEPGTLTAGAAWEERPD